MRVSRLMFAIAVLVPAIASAHSWYPNECCHDQDCWPMGDALDAREPAPKAVAAGWQLHDGRVVPFENVRVSPDRHFHVCRSGAAENGAVISPYGKPLCLWVPSQGS